MNMLFHTSGTRRGARARSVGRTLVSALVGLALSPALGSAQAVDPADRLSGRLPADVEAMVLERIATAAGQDLPTASLVDLALQGVAKGRAADDVLAALDRQLGTLTQARSALAEAGTAPTEVEIDAAELALRMGIDADAVSELARSRPAGRSLEIPLLVLGGLSQRGLPSDQALTRVLDGLRARVGDAELLAGVPDAARPGGPAGGLPIEPPAGPFAPDGAGAALGGPPSGVPIPVGPAGGIRPGRPPMDGPPGGGPPSLPGLPGGG
ncbi:MAG: hypothetical protein WEA34_13765 [Gemmatimonadota bacterium]